MGEPSFRFTDSSVRQRFDASFNQIADIRPLYCPWLAIKKRSLGSAQISHKLRK